MENNRVCEKCGGISGWDSYFDAWICTRCGDMVQKHITNGDKIRTMTNKELVDIYFYILNNILRQYTNSRQGLLKWLEQEYKNDL